ncbi:MAG: bifunctional adenosylcobinamide kinase/adenosylcobinamide-phosphate guanylyltransferase [Veillonella parvula]|mgnify:FL=1|uniref:bifunctional adenosylcobinamide kinase/adenosylcobinamide-phosphate guanylyltransferase n=2 Tax=Veillonella parvula TaxID=29466 RepID=UPI002675E20F|nr:bifunctional adenosylcobinamide kinase/adenosylcobinamide-phosphate guanylyltransferase [Veillonella parvula]MDU4429622.1 bifunctional adenosylcobinamide kinase/adenosylcobinamide-phosphate guanylyltransferase [Veillonella parvula]MDU7464634.1 bifunctional adenosylcobinamide kinase/adenosylcobinamide-phosphate guanylyltransferase [Veillonella parvula]
MKSQIILCSGGARSGKSEFAERLALATKGQKAYVATGQAFDEEMVDRIKKHQERRGKIWNNFEVPLHLADEWENISQSADVILIDCLTMFTTNHMMAYGSIRGQEDANRLEQTILSELDILLDSIQSCEGKTVIFVTNEIGLGIVPDNKLARYFRDIAGRVNRAVASVADKLYLTISGVTIELKSQEVHING